MNRRPFRMLLERDVAEIERRLRLYRENAPKRICGAGEPIRILWWLRIGRTYRRSTGTPERAKAVGQR